MHSISTSSTIKEEDEEGFSDRDNEDDEDSSGDDSERQGSWMRRRRMDGSLNRVPMGFYAKIWNVLEFCQALLMKGSNTLSHSLTQEVKHLPYVCESL